MKNSAWDVGRSLALCIVSLLLVVACGGGGGAGTPPAPPAATTYSIGGTVKGLASGQAVQLSDGIESVSVNTAGSFNFPTSQQTGTSYTVTVQTQPTGQFCNVSSGTGSVASNNITAIAVVCAVTLPGGNGSLGTSGGTVHTAVIDVTAAAGAAVVPINITVTTVAPPAGFPTALTPIGAAVDVALDHPEGLNAPLSMTIRYDASVVQDENSLLVVHYDTATNKYEPVTIYSQDKTAHSLTFDSRSFSPFLVASATAAPASFTVEKGPSGSVTNWSSNANGWDIVNLGDAVFSPDGWCLGMAAYAVWYYNTEGTNLYGAFPSKSTFGTWGSTDPPSVEQIIAIRAMLAQSQFWAGLNINTEQAFGTAALGKNMKILLSTFHQPLILLLLAPNAGHAGVLYGYDSNYFYFYDVNHPGSELKLPFDGTSFGTYTDGGNTYGTFGYVALPSLGRTLDFQTLTTQATQGFSYESTNLLQVNSPAPGTAIPVGLDDFTGTLSSALPAATEVVAYVTGSKGYTVLDQGPGVFHATLPVVAGTVQMVWLAGVALDQQSNWYANSSAALIFQSQGLYIPILTLTSSSTTVPAGGGTVSLTATFTGINPPPSVPAPNGTVTFTDQTSGKALCSGVPMTASGASCPSVSVMGGDIVLATYTPGTYDYYNSATASITISSDFQFVIDSETGFAASLTDITSLTGGIISGPGKIDGGCPSVNCGGAFTATGGSYSNSVTLSDAWAWYDAMNNSYDLTKTMTSTLQATETLTSGAQPSINMSSTWTVGAGAFQSTVGGSVTVQFAKPYTLTASCTYSAAASPCLFGLPGQASKFMVYLLPIDLTMAPTVDPNSGMLTYQLGAGTYNIFWVVLGCCLGAPDDGSGPQVSASGSVTATFQATQ